MTTSRAPVIDKPVNAIPGKRTNKAQTIRKLHLDYPELSEANIAKHVGCSRANVNQVLARFLDPERTNQDLNEFQNEKANIYDAIQYRILSSVTQADIAKAPLVARVTSAAILEDKARVIRGMATQINVSVLLDAVNMAKEIQASRDAEAMAEERRRMQFERGEA